MREREGVGGGERQRWPVIKRDRKITKVESHKKSKRRRGTGTGGELCTVWVMAGRTFLPRVTLPLAHH